MAILTQQLPNGLALLAEPMPWLESAAFAILVPAGCSRDPDGRAGVSAMTCEMIQRGSGTRDSRQFIEDLELLGVDFSSAVSNAHTSFGGAMPAESLFDALAIYADLVRKPHLPPKQLADARLTCLQDVRALEDDLPQKMMQRLRWRYYGDPFGRSSQGTLESLERIKLADIRHHVEATFVPTGAILSVAGKIDWPSLQDHVAQLFGDWSARPLPALTVQPPTAGYEHIEQDSSQTHIGLAYDSVPFAHPDYYDARAAIGVLSDGMSSRLFTEVREKRGLCYTVYAASHSLKDRGSVICYAGTTTDRAQETYDVILAEVLRLTAGIEEDELRRLKSKLKSSLIMQQESSPARSGSMAAEWYHLGRTQTLDELGQIIDNLNVKNINTYLAAHPPHQFTTVTLGAKPLKIHAATA